MVIGGFQPQVWFSVFVVIATVGIALLTSLLKKRNDRMREIVLELRMRREEEQRRLAHDRLTEGAMIHSKPAPPEAAPETAAAVERAPAPAATEVLRDTAAQRESRVRDRNIAIRRSHDRDPEFTAKPVRKRRRSAPAEFPKTDNMNTKEALSGWLNRRSAALTSSQAAFTSPAIEAPAQESTDVALLDGVEPAAPETASPAETNRASVFIDEFLWESIVRRSAVVEPAAPVQTPRLELIQGSGSGWPAGMQDESALAHVMNRAFPGLALAIGVYRNDGRTVSREVMQHVEQLVRGLMGDGDFACQCADNEFLLLAPGLEADEAQRRSSEISERLWDFQLRGTGNFSALFSTGDAQSTDEPLRDAIATARARLQQTRRARKMVSFDFLSRRKAASAAV